MYMVKYMSKGHRGISTLMDQACIEVREGNQSLVAQIRTAGNVWTNNTEIPVQEAVAYLLQLPFCMSSRSFIFINSAPPEERTRLLKDREALQIMDEDRKSVV